MQTALVFDGGGDFGVWRARVENELMRHHLLGYVSVRGYDGTQEFAFRGDTVPAKSSRALSSLEALKEKADAMEILQRALHPTVQTVVLDKNVYDCWATLCSLYDKNGALRNCDSYAMHRVVNHMWFGDKAHEPMDEFVTRWKMAVEQYAQVVGLNVTDAYLYVMLVQALPKSWRSSVDQWRGPRLFVPFDEMVEKVIAKSEEASTADSNSVGRTHSREERARTNTKQIAGPFDSRAGGHRPTTFVTCYYCFRMNHDFTRCQYLHSDIANGKTHSQRSKYSCVVTDRRKPWMVEQLDKFIQSKLLRMASGPSGARGRSISRPRRSPSRARPRPRPRPSCPVSFERSKSVFPQRDPEERRPMRSSRSQSTFRGSEDPMSRYRPRTPSFERALRSPL